MNDSEMKIIREMVVAMNGKAHDKMSYDRSVFLAFKRLLPDGIVVKELNGSDTLYVFRGRNIHPSRTNKSWRTLDDWIDFGPDDSKGEYLECLTLYEDRRGVPCEKYFMNRTSSDFRGFLKAQMVITCGGVPVDALLKQLKGELTDGRNSEEENQGERR